MVYGRQAVTSINDRPSKLIMPFVTLSNHITSDPLHFIPITLQMTISQRLWEIPLPTSVRLDDYI